MTITPRRAGPGIAAILSVLSVACGDRREGSFPPLILSEAVSRSLPTDFNLAGMSLGTEGEVFVWSRTPNLLLRLGSELSPNGSWLLPDSIAPLAVGSTDDVIEIALVDRPVLYRLDPLGSATNAVPLPVDGLLLAAQHSAEGWYTLSESYATGVRTVELHGSGIHWTVPSYGALTPTEDGLWVTESLFPFSARHLPRSEEEGKVLIPPLEALERMRAAAGQADFSGWSSLPLVVLRSGYLQTITDLTEDRRLLVVYDVHGSVRSTLAVDAPIGILLGSPDYSSVYAARRTDILEIVKYTY